MPDGPDRGCCDAGAALPEWLLVRRVFPGKPGFDGAAAALFPEHKCAAAGVAWEDAQVFVLSDPAADPDRAPAAVVLVVPVDQAVMEIKLARGGCADLIVRLLVPAMDALRAQGVRRVICAPGGLAEDAALVLEGLGFRLHGEYLALEL